MTVQTSTPYEGGVFFILIEMPNDYPLAPPRCRFITPVYHPNIDTFGNICLEIFEPKLWNPVWNLELSKQLRGIFGALLTKVPFSSYRIMLPTWKSKLRGCYHA